MLAGDSDEPARVNAKGWKGMFMSKVDQVAGFVLVLRRGSEVCLGSNSLVVSFVCSYSRGGRSLVIGLEQRDHELRRRPPAVTIGYAAIEDQTSQQIIFHLFEERAGKLNWMLRGDGDARCGLTDGAKNTNMPLV